VVEERLSWRRVPALPKREKRCVTREKTRGSIRFQRRGLRKEKTERNSSLGGVSDSHFAIHKELQKVERGGLSGKGGLGKKNLKSTGKGLWVALKT